MDQFGVLVESIGFKAPRQTIRPNGQSERILHSNSNNKPSNNNTSSNGFPGDIGINSNSNSKSNDLDVLFGSANAKPPKSDFDVDDVFGGLGFGGFQASSSTNYSYNNSNNDADVFGFGLIKSSSSSTSGDHFDVLGNRVSPVVKTKPVDDFIRDFDGMGINTGGGNRSNYNANVMKSTGLKKTPVKKQEPADLLSGFGVKSSSLNGRKSEANTGVRSAKSFSGSADDPFGMFETTQVNNGASDYLDSLFSSSTQPNTRSNQSFTTEDSVYDSLFNNVVPKQQNKASSNITKQASSKPISTADDFSYLFGMGVAPTSGEFQEIEGGK
ncbi:uncharacterized protein LOC143605983 [Bidens hawaiensis]|uniref:uncharacterized protein LOC143605983 n=1 Tax=Bidens hawaiensis TaxID=980011 RepID=UPI00404AA728